MPDALQSEKCFACTPPSVCDSPFKSAFCSRLPQTDQIAAWPWRTRDSTSTFVQFTQLNCSFARCSQPPPKRHAVGRVMWHIGGATENRLLYGGPWRLLGALGKMNKAPSCKGESILAFKCVDSISCRRYWFHWTFLCPWQQSHWIR